MLDRARKNEPRSRGDLRVHDAGPAVVDAADEYEQLGRDLGMIPGGPERRYTDSMPRAALEGAVVQVGKRRFVKLTA